MSELLPGKLYYVFWQNRDIRKFEVLLMSMSIGLSIELPLTHPVMFLRSIRAWNEVLYMGKLYQVSQGATYELC